MSAMSSEVTPHSYARRLLAGLGLPDIVPVAFDQRSARELWALSGAKWLSGHAVDRPRDCPAPLAACAQGAWLALSSVSAGLDPHFEAFRLLGERAAIAGLRRNGRTSAGGACQLLATADGWLAINLARADDLDLLPAWLECDITDPAELPALLTQRSTAVMIERARWLGLAAAPLTAPRRRQRWFYARRWGTVSKPRVTMATAKPPLVIDLSSLWAGPLCGELLAQSGARVIKVESHHRPDGARQGPQPFYDLMNAGKASVALDFSRAKGRAQLKTLLQAADIVIESARPRGLQQLGICARELLATRPGKVWLSITGYGRRAPLGEWIAYGDDAGVAAGLSWLMGGAKGDPVFCGDAIADPLTGLHGALLALVAWQRGGGVLLDLSLHRVVSQCIQAGIDAPPIESDDYPAAPPLARAVSHSAAALGRDTDRVLGELL